jgi:hypothetical protein
MLSGWRPASEAENRDRKNQKSYTRNQSSDGANASASPLAGQDTKYGAGDNDAGKKQRPTDRRAQIA